jgi:uncharacterized phage protein (TIGR02218 family)
LYKVTYQGLTYRYAASADDIEYNGYIYSASSFARTELTMELTDSEVRVTTKLDTDPFTKFVLYAPSAELFLNIYDYASGLEIFSGILVKLDFDRERFEVDLKFKKKEVFFDSEVPYRTYSTSCPFILYDGNCGLSSSAYTTNITEFTVAGSQNAVTVPSIAGSTGLYTGGVLTTNNTETAYILKHDSGGVLYLDTRITQTPSVISLKQGCDKSYSTCSVKFNNKTNFGGFPLVPPKNPSLESI